MAPRLLKLNITVAVSLGLVGLLGVPAGAAAVSPVRFVVNTILSGTSLHHRYTPAGGGPAKSESLTKPDDVTILDGHLFVGFQNGVGPQGEPSGDGNQDSTVVELDMGGRPISQWDIMGKADGVTADPQLALVVATVNEDARSSLYTIDPSAAGGQQVVHYHYDEPLPHNGGTDAISVDHGQLFVSASAPGTTGAPAPEPSYPAVYQVSLDAGRRVAAVTALFGDQAEARVANLGPRLGRQVALALTDPDSSEVVPAGASRFGGDFMLTSQGDQEQIYVNGPSSASPSLAVLSLNRSVDDMAWPTDGGGRLFSTDATNDAVDVVTGGFVAGQPLVVATPCGSNSAPATCPAPGFPANYLAALDQFTGQVQRVSVTGAAYVPQGGLVFLP